MCCMKVLKLAQTSSFCRTLDWRSSWISEDIFMFTKRPKSIAGTLLIISFQSGMGKFLNGSGKKWCRLYAVKYTWLKWKIQVIVKIARFGLYCIHVIFIISFWRINLRTQDYYVHPMRSSLVEVNIMRFLFVVDCYCWRQRQSAFHWLVCNKFYLL